MLVFHRFERLGAAPSNCVKREKYASINISFVYHIDRWGIGGARKEALLTRLTELYSFDHDVTKQ